MSEEIINESFSVWKFLLSGLIGVIGSAAIGIGFVMYLGTGMYNALLFFAIPVGFGGSTGKYLSKLRENKILQKKDIGLAIAAGILVGIISGYFFGYSSPFPRVREWWMLISPAFILFTMILTSYI